MSTSGVHNMRYNKEYLNGVANEYSYSFIAFESCDNTYCFQKRDDDTHIRMLESDIDCPVNMALMLEDGMTSVRTPASVRADIKIVRADVRAIGGDVVNDPDILELQEDLAMMLKYKPV